MKLPHLLFLAISCSVLFASCGVSGTNIPGDPVPASTEPVSPKNKPNLSLTHKNSPKVKPAVGLKGHIDQAITYVQQNGYSTEYCFLVDLGIKSGKNRFFVYDLQKNTIALSGLVAHGSCNTQFLSQAKFSNTPDCGCSSLGKYKVGAFYMGEWGKSYRLYGLDNSNSNAFKRGIVIHGHDCVPDEEIYPRVLCNSFGCPMVSVNFFEELSGIIKKSEKPILLWIYK